MISSLSLKVKIALGAIPILLLFLMFGIYIKNFQETTEENTRRLEGVLKSGQIAVELRSINSSLTENTRLYALTADPAYEQRHEELSRDFDRVYEVLYGQEKDRPGVELLLEFKRITDGLKGTELLIFAKTKEAQAAAAHQLLDEVYTDNEKRATDALNTYVEDIQAEAYASIQKSLEGTRARQIRLIGFTVLFVSMTVFIIYIIIRKFIIVPITELSRAAVRIKEGDFGTRVKVYSADEVGGLGTAFNSMADRLQEEIRKRSEENVRLRELDERKSQFISVVAHQLRTPLSGIKWILHMAVSGELGPLTPDLASFLNKSYKSNERMIALVNEMLGISRVESGTLQFQFSLVDVSEIAKKVIAEMTPEARQKNISLDLSFEPGDYRVTCDADKIFQVYQNLIENSIRYTPPDGKIILRLEIKDGTVLSSVTDTGIGIPEKDKKEIFGRFFRSPNAMKMETDGTGLGLYIVKIIVERNKGKIWFESTEGKGTTFFFTLPVHTGSKKSIIKP